MKKLIVLSLAAAILTACGQKKETVEKSAPKSEQQTTTTTTSSSSEKKIEKTSPADYSRSHPSAKISSDTLDAIKSHVGYYTGTITTTLDTINSLPSSRSIPLTYFIELAITDDGTYVQKVTHTSTGTSETNRKYIDKNNNLLSTLKGTEVLAGWFELEYGQLAFHPHPYDQLIGAVLDQNGDLSYIYHHDKLVPQPDALRLSFNGDDVIATINEEQIILKASGKIPNYLKFTPYQLHNYHDDTHQEYDDTYDLTNVNEFFQLFHTGYHIEIINPKELPVYYTEDNQKIEQLLYALYFPEVDKTYGYDGQHIWSLYTDKSINKAVLFDSQVKKLMNFTEFMEDN